jgi:hypothetical protein
MSHLLTKNMSLLKLVYQDSLHEERWRNSLNNIQESLKMKAALFQWVSRAVDESTNVSDTKQQWYRRGVQYNGAALMAMKGTTGGAQRSSLTSWITVACSATGVFSLITIDVKNTADRDLIICNRLIL